MSYLTWSKFFISLYSSRTWTFRDK